MSKKNCNVCPPQATRNPLWIPLFNAFMQLSPTIPDLYWNVMSQEQRILSICQYLDLLQEYANKLCVQINYNTDEIAKLVEEFDKFRSGAYDTYYEEIIAQWVNDHMPEIIRQAIKMVFFGLTDDGYFVAYIPESWSDIKFDTGAVYGTEQYGRLILRMEVDGNGVIDNTDPHYGEQEIPEPTPPADYTVIFNRAMAELGKPYQFGGVGPVYYDSSGLVSYAVSGKHIRLGTVTQFAQWEQIDNPTPGAVVVYGTGSCGIYSGPGQMITSLNQRGVTIVSVQPGSTFHKPPTE